MRIACLAWGSLVWDPGDLPLRTTWMEDGPKLPIEFARQSQDGRLTLVMCSLGTQVQTLWAELDCEDLEVATDVLRRREKIPKANESKHIGVVVRDIKYTELHFVKIQQWLDDHNLDAAVFTSLPPKFNLENDVMPTGKEVLEYLKSLTGPTKLLAENYIRKTPVQIATKYRKLIEDNLGWLPK